MISREKWLAQIAPLRQDNTSGASEITARALEMLIDAVGDFAPESPERYRDWLLQIGRDLVATQPSMGGLFRLVNDMLWACDTADEAASVRRAALDFLQSYRQERAAALEMLAGEAWNALRSFEAIMTYSRSATLLNVLRNITERGFEPRIYCSEGRPVFEGQTLASELSWLGLDVVLGIDMALFGWLDEVDALVLGADSLSTRGLTNKIGTATLARVASARGIPVTVVCTTEKFLPAEYVVGQELSSGPQEEIMPVSDQEIEVRNVYFDVTPLSEITQVVTEQGALRRRELRDALEAVETYPGLRGS